MTEQNTQVEQTEERGRRKVLTGVVVSDKKHPLYGKVITKSERLQAHDEENTAGIGDRVRVMETRPLSAKKRWRLTEIVERAK